MNIEHAIEIEQRRETWRAWMRGDDVEITGDCIPPIEAGRLDCLNKRLAMLVHLALIAKPEQLERAIDDLRAAIHPAARPARYPHKVTAPNAVGGGVVAAGRASARCRIDGRDSRAANRTASR